MSHDNIVIVAAKRTPMGAMMGSLSALTATDLGAEAIKSSVEAAGIDANQVDEVVMGCVLPAGLGQSPARQASLKAGLPLSAGVTTINKVCGSGMKAAMMAHDLIKAGSAEVVVAGGMESMSNAPYLLPKARAGYRMGHGEVKDHMMLDGLENAYDGMAMGCFAQGTADSENMTREEMDDYTLTTLTRAQHAIKAGHFDNEVCKITIKGRKGDIEVTQDELPGKAMPEKIPNLRPAFAKDGTITAANSSAISDGAASLLIMTESKAKALGLPAIARIVTHATNSIEPENFTVAPVDAIRKVLDKAQWAVGDVDLFEINEAFAMVTMLAIKHLELDPEKVNVHGGACALGHPIGASGTRLIVTLLHALKQRNLSKGVASLCIGGGEATAIAVEML